MYHVFTRPYLIMLQTEVAINLNVQILTRPGVLLNYSCLIVLDWMQMQFQYIYVGVCEYSISFIFE